MIKGISAIISVILILLIMVSLVLVAYAWSRGSFLQIIGGWKPEQISVSKESCLMIENIDTINKKIVIRNCGSTQLSNFKVYVDEEIITSDSRTLNAGDITSIDYGGSIEGEHSIYVTSNYAEAPYKILEFPTIYEEPWQEMFLSGCSILDKERTIYYLTTDILNSGTDYCMNISANNVVLDCQGHTIDGKGASTFNGIYAFRSPPTTTNITINNCTVTEWATGGITFFSASGNTIKNSAANSNTDSGIYLVISPNNQLSNITANSNSNYGIWLSNSLNNQLSNITANSNQDYGIYLYVSSNNNQITNSIVQGNTVAGIYIATSQSNKIYNNLFNNTKNFYFAGTIYVNYWNTTRQTGKRTYSAGTEIGGNYWTNSSKNGYSDTCADSNKDGFCDTPYILDPGQTGNNTDYLPLSDEYIP
jgi:parallel beta-helix repeat protein